MLIKQQAVSDLPTKLQSMSIEEHEQSVPSSPAKMPLPMKLPKKQGIKLTLSSDLPPVINEINVNNNNNNNNDDDDYDYDIPENNRPVALSSLSTSNNSNSRVIAKSVNANLLPSGVVRKSISPTIDSGKRKKVLNNDIFNYFKDLQLIKSININKLMYLLIQISIGFFI